MSAPAQVTEAHLALARDMAAQGQYLSHSIQYYSRLIANSEAREVALHRHIATQLAAVLNAAGAPEFANADHASQWAKEISGLTAERDQLRTELALLREWQREVIQNANAHHAERKDAIARAESAEREAFDWKKIARYETARAERAEAELAEQKYIKRSAVKRANELTAELDGIRALADRRNERDHSQDTTHQLVAALDQALDIAQAELATERARLDWLMAGGVCMVQHTGGFHVSRLHYPVSRAAIDAAMKEGK